MDLTADTITDEDIETLRAAAVRSGDLITPLVCAPALARDPGSPSRGFARHLCAQLVNAAMGGNPKATVSACHMVALDVEALARGRLSEHGRWRVASHLATCKRCFAERAS